MISLGSVQDSEMRWTDAAVHVFILCVCKPQTHNWASSLSAGPQLYSCSRTITENQKNINTSMLILQRCIWEATGTANMSKTSVIMFSKLHSGTDCLDRHSNQKADYLEVYAVCMHAIIIWDISPLVDVIVVSDLSVLRSDVGGWQSHCILYPLVVIVIE